MHLESIGLDYKRLYDEGIVFVLVSQALNIIRLPKSREVLKIATCPAALKGARLMRETVIIDDAGGIIVEGQSSWAMINPLDQKILRPSDLPCSLPLLGKAWKPFFDPNKFALPATKGDYSSARTTVYSDLDLNMHMNNAVHADILLDAYGELLLNNSVSQLFLRYRTQALLGDCLELRTFYDAGRYCLKAVIDDRLCFEGAFTLKYSDG